MGVYFESFLTDLVLASVILVTTIYVYFKYKYQYWTRNNIAQLDPTFPIGNMGGATMRQESMTTTFYKMHQEFKARNVPVGGYYFFSRPELMLLDLDIIKQVLIKEFHRFTDRGVFADEETDPLTAHLFSRGGEKWKNIRAKVSPAFTTANMKMLFSTLVACSDELNNILNESSKRCDPLNIKDILERFTMDTIGSCAFGLDCNSLKDPNVDFRKYGTLFFEPDNIIDRFRVLCVIFIPKVLKFFKIKGINKKLNDFFMGVVKDTVQYREQNNVYRKDFLQLLIQIKNAESATDDNGIKHDKIGLTIEQIAAECFGIFLGGYETSATTMTFCLYELAKNPEVQEKLREEIVRVLKKYDNKLCYDAIMDMPYLDKCINETFRKYPPLSFLTRTCNEDYKLPNSKYTIRKGDKVVISILGLQKDPEIYPDPEKFDPERFSESEKAKRPSMSFIPFGEGPRICIGMKFGLMQVKVGLPVLLKNYKFTLNKKTREPLVMDPNNFIMSSKGRIWLDVQKVTA